MKPVERYNEKGEVVETYPGVRAAAEALGTLPQRVVECCQGKRRLKAILGNDKLRYVTAN